MAQSKVAATAVILAGGRGTRIDGQDKGLISVRGAPLIRHILDRLEPQIERILINANRNEENYASFGWPIVNDANDRFDGPLAGILAAMQHCDDDWLITLPCDSPFPARDYVARMLAVAEAKSASIAVATDGERQQPVFLLVRRSLRDDLAAFLQDGQRKIDRWFAHHQTAETDFSNEPSMFLNINTNEELAKLASNWPLLTN